MAKSQARLCHDQEDGGFTVESHSGGTWEFVMTSREGDGIEQPTFPCCETLLVTVYASWKFILVFHTLS